MTAAGIDREAVSDWLREEAPQVELPVTFHLLSGGHSNFTYEMRDASGHSWVLRRPPLGDIPPTAHDMAREYRVLTALGATTVPVPRTVALCDDPKVSGATFYVMEHISGTILRDATAADQIRPRERRTAGLSAAEVMAKIHAVDPDAVGLGDFGRRDGYVERQLRRWHGQWERWRIQNIPLIDVLHQELSGAIPPQRSTSLVHGDYRLENCVLDGDGTVAAVLDWELCTLGDPLADVGLLVIYWTEAGDSDPIFPRSPTVSTGMPTRSEMLQRYEEVSQRDLSQIGFYVAFGYWKLACISAGTYARYQSGEMGDREAFEGIEDQAMRCAQHAADAWETR